MCWSHIISNVDTTLNSTRVKTCWQRMSTEYDDLTVWWRSTPCAGKTSCSLTQLSGDCVHGTQALAALRASSWFGRSARHVATYLSGARSLSLSVAQAGRDLLSRSWAGMLALWPMHLFGASENFVAGQNIRARASTCIYGEVVF